MVIDQRPYTRAESLYVATSLAKAPFERLQAEQVGISSDTVGWIWTVRLIAV